MFKGELMDEKMLKAMAAGKSSAQKQNSENGYNDYEDEDCMDEEDVHEHIEDAG